MQKSQKRIPVAKLEPLINKYRALILQDTGGHSAISIALATWLLYSYMLDQQKHGSGDADDLMREQMEHFIATHGPATLQTTS